MEGDALGRGVAKIVEMQVGCGGVHGRQHFGDGFVEQVGHCARRTDIKAGAIVQIFDTARRGIKGDEPSLMADG